MSRAARLRRKLLRTIRVRQRARALITETGALSYLEIGGAIDQLAHALDNHTRERSGTVALTSARIDVTILSGLACIVAGKPFVVLPPDETPSLQRRRILDQCDADVVLCAPPVSAALAELGFSHACDVAAPGGALALLVRQARAVAVPDDVFALVHTSGTGGEPRVVACSETSLLRHLRCMHRFYRTSKRDVAALTAPLSLLSAWNDVFLALLSGATLCPVNFRSAGIPPALRTLHDAGVTYLHLVPSLLRLITDRPGAAEQLSTLRCVKVGGEAMAIEDVHRVRQVLPADCLILHSYGATETGGSVTVLPIRRTTRLTGERLSVGKPVKGHRIRLVDDSGRVVGRDEIGEIVVEGKWFASGYYKRPDLTEENFRRVAGRSRARYHTGDVGYVSSADGMLRHVGRKDHVIKKNGMRVNPTDVELELQAHPAIAAAAVLAVSMQAVNANDCRLHAFYVPRSDVDDPGEQALRRFLLTKMPHRMLPARIQRERQFPLLPNGKVDRRRLVESASLAERAPSVPPRSEMERIVAAAFTQVLDSPIGAYDDFWENGGDSLAAMAACAALEERIRHQVPPHLLGQYPTAAELAEIIKHLMHRTDSEARASHDDLLVTILGSGNRPQAVVLPGGVGSEGSMALFVRMLSNVPEITGALGFRAASLYHCSEKHDCVEDVARIYVRALEKRGLARHGLAIIGECVAGAVAFEVARLRNLPDDRLILMDARPPGHRPYRTSVDAFSPFYRRYARAVRCYGRHAYDGGAQLIVSDEYQSDDDAALGWGDRIRGPVRIRRVAGDHCTYLRDNHRGTASALRECLAEVPGGREVA